MKVITMSIGALFFFVFWAIYPAFLLTGFAFHPIGVMVDCMSAFAAWTIVCHDVLSVLVG